MQIYTIIDKLTNFRWANRLKIGKFILRQNTIKSD